MTNPFQNVPGPAGRRAWLRRAFAPVLACGFAGTLASLASGPASAQAARYEIDTEHLSIGFLVHHISYMNILGMFRSATGTYSYDEKTGTLSDVRSIPAACSPTIASATTTSRVPTSSTAESSRR